MLIFGAQKRSYRELPLRICDQGVLHRNELRGALGGLTRVRQFCQDDAHLFVTEEQIESEVTALLALVGKVYKAFDMDFKAKLSTRPDKKLGSDAHRKREYACSLAKTLRTLGRPDEAKPLMAEYIGIEPRADPPPGTVTAMVSGGWI